MLSSTDYETARQRIEDSDLSPGKKKLALWKLAHDEREKVRTAGDALPAPRPVSPAPRPVERRMWSKPEPVASLPLGWLLATVGASSVLGGAIGAVIAGVLT